MKNIKEHRFHTFSDLDNVPDEKFEHMLEDLYDWLRLRRALKHFSDELCEQLNIPNAARVGNDFIWIDDGEHNKSIRIDIGDESTTDNW